MKDTDWENDQETTLTEQGVFKLLKGRPMLLAPVQLQHASFANGTISVEATWGEMPLTFQGVVRARSTPQQLQVALDQVRNGSLRRHPLVVVPYLSEVALQRLETAGVSGVDLCGNGVLIVPGNILVRSTGAPNQYPESSPIRNPFTGRAAVVTRRLALQLRWDTLSELNAAIERDAEPVSLALCSKVVSALVDQNLVAKDQRQIRVRDRLGILDGLAHAWSRERPRRVQPVHLNSNLDPARHLAQHMDGKRWVIGGASSVTMYEVVAQSGPLQVIVDDIDQVMQAAQASPEPIPSFASAVLVEYDDPGCKCGTHVDNSGIRWSGPLQVWLELQAGDARQREMAKDLFGKIL